MAFVACVPILPRGDVIIPHDFCVYLFTYNSSRKALNGRQMNSQLFVWAHNLLRQRGNEAPQRCWI